MLLLLYSFCCTRADAQTSDAQCLAAVISRCHAETERMHHNLIREMQLEYVYLMEALAETYVMPKVQWHAFECQHV